MKSLKLLLLLFVLFLTGCGSAISSGYITSKEFKPSYTYFTMQCAAYNSKAICISWIQIPHTVPDRYILNLEDGEKTGWASVDPSTYESYEVGDFYGTSASND